MSPHPGLPCGACEGLSRYKLGSAREPRGAIDCASCGNSGLARGAFRRGLARAGIGAPAGYTSTVTPDGSIWRAKLADLGLDGQHTVVAVFAHACHGEGTPRAERTIAVLQHLCDPAALDTVWRLGRVDQTFSWLCQQELEHCGLEEEA